LISCLCPPDVEENEAARLQRSGGGAQCRRCSIRPGHFVVCAACPATAGLSATGRRIQCELQPPAPKGNPLIRENGARVKRGVENCAEVGTSQFLTIESVIDEVGRVHPGEPWHDAGSVVACAVPAQHGCAGSWSEVVWGQTTPQASTGTRLTIVGHRKYSKQS
jgi:hypothetical protein